MNIVKHLGWQNLSSLESSCFPLEHGTVEDWKMNLDSKKGDFPLPSTSMIDTKRQAPNHRIFFLELTKHIIYSRF